MRARIGAGIAGWLIAVVPLVGVNIAAYAGVFGYDTPLAAGMIALVGGIVLGGALSGALAGRRGGGVAGAAVGGGSAALLYAVTIIALMFSTSYFASAPPLIAEHPIGASVAVVFCAALLLAVALLVGTLVGGESASQSAAARNQLARSQAPRPTVPLSGLPGQQWEAPRVSSTPITSRQRPPSEAPQWASYDDDGQARYSQRHMDAERISRPVAPRQRGVAPGHYDDRRG